MFPSQNSKYPRYRLYRKFNLIFLEKMFFMYLNSEMDITFSNFFSNNNKIKKRAELKELYDTMHIPHRQKYVMFLFSKATLSI